MAKKLSSSRGSNPRPIGPKKMSSKFKKNYTVGFAMIHLYEKCHYFIKNLNLEGDIGYFSSRPIFTLKFFNLQSFNQTFNYLRKFFM